MNQDSLTTSFWVMVLIQTIGSVDLPGMGLRKMPSPAHYVAIVVTWLVLFIVASWNDSARRATTAMGWLLVLVGTVIGPFGKALVSLFNGIAKRYGIQSGAGPQQPTVNADPFTGQPLGPPQQP